MKHIFSAVATLVLFGLVSCGNDKGRELSDYPEASTGDSLLYYYMQMKAQEYWDRANSDTALRNPEQRKRFLEGVEKGISLVGDDDNYNRGLRLGVRFATNTKDFERKYDVDLNDEIMIEGLRYGLRDGNEDISIDNQKEFYRLLDKMKTALKEKEEAIAVKALADAAEKNGLEKISDNLFYKVIRKGSGPMVRDGDIIEVAADYERSDGENLGLPSPVTVTVGETSVPIVMNTAYKLLNRGTTAKFATTARALFGSRTSIMGLQDCDIVVISMILNDITTPSGNHPGSTVVPRQ